MESALPEVRNSLNKFLIQLSDTMTGASSRHVVSVFRSSESDLIARASKELEDATLVQMVSALKKRRPVRSVEPVQDLFAGLDQVVTIVVFEEGKKVKRNKTPRKLTLKEAEACLASHRADRERNDHLINALENIIATARPFIGSEGTLEDGVAAAQAAAEENSVLGKT